MPADSPTKVNSPVAAQESLAHFQIDPGLKIELVACEPEVVDPIAIRFDELGRLWVVEMRDYPHGPPDKQPPLSRIRLLSDGDGDGRYEQSKVFADRLLFPTGIQPWKGGLIVTLSGKVVYLKDTDGDDRADQSEVWFEGFAEENPQLRANHPRFGPDNRIYIANGLRGGAIVDLRRSNPKQNRPALSISGMDFHFDPRTDFCQAVSGNGQFGLTFDDAGHRFVCNNRVPIQQVVLENKYLARNPLLAVASVLDEAAPSGERSRVYPRTSAWTTSNLHAGQFTAACGVEIYRGDALGDAYYGNAFICEPTGSLVHREVLTREGVTFTSHCPNAGRDFLSSDDPWFRPVNLEVGPDGALYVVDMYRAVIEHPQYMPSELQKRPDLRLGDDRGRIYRIVRADKPPAVEKPNLSSATTRELVAALAHDNAWWRETAARLIYERQDHEGVTQLEAIAANSSNPAARLAALGALDGLSAVTTAAIQRALRDSDAGVRQRGIALSEQTLAGDAKLRGLILSMAADPDAAVRFQAALTIGGLTGEEPTAALVTIALLAPGDAWTRAAVASALPEQSAAVLRGVLASNEGVHRSYHSPQLALMRELATIVGSRRDVGELAQVLAATCSLGDALAPVREAVIAALAQGIQRRGGSFASFVAEHAELAHVADKLAVVYDRAAELAVDERCAEEARSAKIELLGFARTTRAQDALLSIVAQCPSQALRLGAVGALAGQTANGAGRELIAGFQSQTPTVRRAIVDALLADTGGSQVLLDAVESQQVARAEIDTARRTRLVKHPDAAVRRRAASLLADASPAERRAVLAEYRDALTLKGDPLAGKELFRKHCAGCHQVGGIGVDVAPDISDSRVKTPDQLLVDILNPNQAIDNNYISYTVVTRDGTVHSGIVVSETPASITLKNQDAKTQPILRADVESIRSSGQSLMPEGFEKSLSRQDVADLISYVKNWRYLAERIPGTFPPRADD